MNQSLMLQNVHTVVMGHGRPDYQTFESTVECATVGLKAEVHMLYIGPSSPQVTGHAYRYAREHSLVVTEKSIGELLHFVDRVIVFMRGFSEADIAAVDQLRKNGPAVTYFILD